jgi:hemerythrin-like metal-binding protein
MVTTSIAKGVSLVEIPEVGLSLLCGCPENVVKHLMKAGAIRPLTKGGVSYETGPNAILLSESSVLGGRFANAAEFPVLQMLYRQGMLVPGHPGNTGRKPMLVGIREQIEAQSRYIYIGNYGLSTLEELVSAGLDEATARERLRMKLRFAFGKIRATEELLDLRVVDAHAVELRDGVFVRRLGPNRYSIIHGGEAVEVSLDSGDLPVGAPYGLPRVPARRAEFSVIHLGEGDGWDPSRPCVGSLVMWKGEAWLVDAGPDIEASLEAVGLGIGDLRGIFHTHVHDDHFIGLASLFRAPHRLVYRAVPWVRTAAAAKLSALAGITEAEFCRYFDVRDLVEGEWNEEDGLEILPVFSPHPVETTIFRFRGLGRSYAHWADLSSFKVLDSMVTADPESPGMAAALVAQVKADYLEPADVKKLDVGGGMIHGEADDFAHDLSGDLLLSHTDSPEAVTRPFGRIAGFGEVSLFAELAEGPVGGGGAEPRGGAIETLKTFAFLGPGFPAAALPGLAASAVEAAVEKGSELSAAFSETLVLILEGKARLATSGENIGTLGPGEVFGEEGVLRGGAPFFRAVALSALRVLLIPRRAIDEVPVFLWRLKELHERRLGIARSLFRFQWRPGYSVGVEEFDIAHRDIFERVRALHETWAVTGDLASLEEGLVKLGEVVRAHYANEEERMAAVGYPGLEEHRRIHVVILEDARAAIARMRAGLEDPDELFAAIKDRLLEHSLLLDRQYMPYLAPGFGR